MTRTSSCVQKAFDEWSKIYDTNDNPTCDLNYKTIRKADLPNTETLEEYFNHFSGLYINKEIPRPENWGGIGIIPIGMEFLIFKTNRFHERVLYVKNGEKWRKQKLQPWEIRFIIK